MADLRIYELPDNIDVTDFYFACDKTGESSAQRLPISYITGLISAESSRIDQNESDIAQNTADIATKLNQSQVDARIEDKQGKVLFSGYITSAGIIQSTRVNESFLGSVSLDGNDFLLTWASGVNINETTFNNSYIMVAMPNNTSNMRCPAYSWESNTTIKIRFRNQSGDVQTTSFQLEIKLW